MSENAFTVTIDVSEDILVRPQYLDTFRRSQHLEPEKLLLAAILEEAVQEYRKYRGAPDSNSRRRVGEVEEWFSRKDKQWIFFFHNVCELLGLDPEYVRGRLSEFRREAAEEDKPVHHGNKPHTSRMTDAACAFKPRLTGTAAAIPEKVGEWID